VSVLLVEETRVSEATLLLVDSVGYHNKTAAEQIAVGLVKSKRHHSSRQKIY
jgi:hypothetical protein